MNEFNERKINLCMLGLLRSVVRSLASELAGNCVITLIQNFYQLPSFLCAFTMSLPTWNWSIALGNHDFYHIHRFSRHATLNWVVPNHVYNFWCWSIDIDFIPDSADLIIHEIEIDVHAQRPHGLYRFITLLVLLISCRNPSKLGR